MTLLEVFSTALIAGIGVGLGLVIINTIAPHRIRVQYDISYDNKDKKNAK